MKSLHLILIASLLSSCTTVKKNGYWQTRRYDYGKHIVKEVKGKRPKRTRPTRLEIQESIPVLQPKSAELYIEVVAVPDLSTFDYIATDKHQYSPTPKIPQDPLDSCDQILLTDSTVIYCKIIDITLEGFVYTPCFDAENTLIMDKRKVREVRYADGRNLTIPGNEATFEFEELSNTNKPHFNPFLTLVIVVLAFFVFPRIFMSITSAIAGEILFFIWLVLPIVAIGLIISLFINKSNERTEK